MSNSEFLQLITTLEQKISILGNIKESDRQKLMKLTKDISEYYSKEKDELIDIRDYFEMENTSLCITDGKGIIKYMNEQYLRESGVSPEYVGKMEPVSDPISLQVIRKNSPIFFTNDGKRYNKGSARFVSGVPIFDERGHIKFIIITLRIEDTVYEQYWMLKQLMNTTESIRIMESPESQQFKSFLGGDPKIQNVRSLMKRVAPTDATVLIMGESGVGKEVVADGIYEMSNRNDKPFIKINCAAIPANLLEAELFGYEKGSFTGANIQGKIGLLEKSNNGTIMLDEIGDFPMELQPKLLRVLQQGEMFRIGSTAVLKLNVRIIAATNVNLKEKIKEGTFREDLFYRLSVFPIFIPPLREHRVDIEGLVKYFQYLYGEKYNRVVHFSDEVMQIFRDYKWPGNIREMQNVIEYLVICTDDNQFVEVNNLIRILKMENSLQDKPIIEQPYEKMMQDRVVPEGSNLFEMCENFESNIIEAALRKTNNPRRAAKLLGIYPSSIYRKMQKYHLQFEETE